MSGSNPLQRSGSGNARLRNTDPMRKKNGIATLSGRNARGENAQIFSYAPKTIFWLSSGGLLNCSPGSLATRERLKVKRNEEGRVSCHHASHLRKGPQYPETSYSRGKVPWTRRFPYRYRHEYLAGPVNASEALSAELAVASGKPTSGLPVNRPQS